LHPLCRASTARRRPDCAKTDRELGRSRKCCAIRAGHYRCSDPRHDPLRVAATRDLISSHVARHLPLSSPRV